MKKKPKIKRNEWTTNEEPIPVAEIEKIARRLKYAFPIRFIELASEFNGGSPDHDTFDVGEREEYVFDHLLRFPDHFTRMQKATSKLLPEGVIPFAVDPLDNAICFDYRKLGREGDPQIVFWDHEAPLQSAESICYLADSFEEFIGKKLYEF